MADALEAARAVADLLLLARSQVADDQEGAVPNFQTFRKRMVPLAKAPYVTIQRRGTMSFNAAAHAALGQPEAIELLYDPDERIIGVRGVDPTVEHAYPLRTMPGKHESGFIVSGTAFTKFYGISTEISKRYRAELDGDILCIDLKQPGTEVTSNRKGRGKVQNGSQNGAGDATALAKDPVS